ncbi:peptidoglycan -binding protein [Inmirania thermothiophila]|uniref:Chemotaxis protein MotB n=1 Tax=Inmirania thermothiophila TaxID=1750597 RepID=A0A3N1Y5Z8_9GAMM|nr:peptidoglycan -binding protein [Inmirania thermothiophila]ROR34233.1 chemotaxis protein MotB [Inmirania thermothiophila]
MFTLARRGGRSVNVWPGFVDALASVLLVFVFLLLLFVLAQFYLTGVIAARDRALDRLQRNIAELAETLALERERRAGLEESLAEVQARLQATLAERERLAGRLRLTTARAEQAEARIAELERRLAEAERTVAADRETIELRLREIASLQADIAALRQVREELERRVGILAAALEERGRTLGALRERSRQLEARLAEAEERTLLAQREVERRDIRIGELAAEIAARDRALAEEQRLSAEARNQVALLNQQIAALRAQIAELEAALDLAQGTMERQKVEIAELGRKLNLALARRVQELARYRSEFFGRLREVLGEHPGIRIVGDRFVFASEIFFDTASAALREEGKRQLARLAATLKDVAARIPPEIDWVLRIDGHTDRRPIHTAEFPSNWELSTARALAVVRFLTAQGIPAHRLVAAGFGEHRPIDPADTPEAWARNRRIEIKLTQP